MPVRHNSPRSTSLLRVLLLATPFVLPQLGAAQAPSKHTPETVDRPTRIYTEEQEALDKRRLAFAWRELELNTRRNNWKLQAENDDLKIEITTLQGSSADTEKLAADKVYASMAQEAVDAQNTFTYFWFIGKGANPPQQVRDLESRFDDAVKKCFPEQTESRMSSDARESCQDLHEIYLGIAPLKDKPNRLYSLFDEPRSVHPTEAQRLLSVDTLRLQADTASHIAASAKNMLLMADRLVIDIDKQLRIDEWSNSMVARHNAAHPNRLMAADSFLHDLLLQHQKALSDLNAKNRPVAVKEHR